MAKLSKGYIKLVYSGYEYPAEVELHKENYNILDSIDDAGKSGLFNCLKRVGIVRATNEFVAVISLIFATSGNTGDRSETAWNLLWVWLNNIGQLAALYSKIHNVDVVRKCILY